MGGSTGINVAGAIRMARDLGPGHTIVTILADYGNRYQTKLFNPEFLREKGLPVPPWLAEPQRADQGPLRMSDRMSNLVSTEWLADHLNDVRVVDASWYMPDDKREPASRIRGGAYSRRGVLRHRRHRRSCHRPAAHDADARTNSPRAVGALGIGDDDMVVVYDGTGMFSAPRVWWMLQGHGPCKDVRCWMAAFPNGSARAAPSKPALPSPKPANFHRRREARDHARLRCGDGASSRTGRPRWWMRAAPAASRRRSRTARRRSRPATCPAPSMCPGAAWWRPMAP